MPQWLDDQLLERDTRSECGQAASADPAAAARYHFQALCAAYISIGTPPLLTDAERARLARQAVPSWSAIAAAAIRSSDEHVIKLVYSAREEDAAYGNPLYRYAAAKKAGLIR